MFSELLRLPFLRIFWPKALILLSAGHLVGPRSENLAST
jgi:hypothetical protein